uniref:Si:ch211-13k12.2 n=1 Tax=Neogobius melanostomus TaxID=47308 RepID=A0A8C6TMC7_9GOBI
MAALRQEHRYGLSCGQIHKGSPNRSLFHVKLTDTALRTLEAYQNIKVSLSQRPTICFTGSQGYLKIPAPTPEFPDGVRVFSFYLSNESKDKPQSSFVCIQQCISGEGQDLLQGQGSIQDKITVCATDDSYQTTRERLSQVEKDIWSRSAIEIKPGPGKCVKVQRKQALVSVTDGFNKLSPNHKRNLASSPVTQRPLVERVIHLLALKPHRKPELLRGLEREGVSPRDKADLNAVLDEVGLGTTLQVQRDWPGYSEEERLLIHRLLIRLDLNQDPATPPHPADSRGPHVRVEFAASRLCSPLKLGGSFTTVTASPKTERTVPPSPLSRTTVSENPCTETHFTNSQHKKKHKKHKDKERERLKPDWSEGSPDQKHNPENLKGKWQCYRTILYRLMFSLGASTTPMLKKYNPITSTEQRQQYQEDFCAEYDEYKALHDHIRTITDIFIQLASKISTLSPGTQEYKVFTIYPQFSAFCSHCCSIARSCENILHSLFSPHKYLHLIFLLVMLI